MSGSVKLDSNPSLTVKITIHNLEKRNSILRFWMVEASTGRLFDLILSGQ
jgi:hypothetical protein